MMFAPYLFISHDLVVARVDVEISELMLSLLFSFFVIVPDKFLDHIVSH